MNSAGFGGDPRSGDKGSPGCDVDGAGCDETDLAIDAGTGVPTGGGLV